MCGKGEGCLIKCDTKRDNDTIRGEVKTAVPFVVGGIAEEHARGRSWSKFMGCCSGEVWIAVTPKDTKMLERGRKAEKNFVRCLEVESSSGMEIE